MLQMTLESIRGAALDIAFKQIVEEPSDLFAHLTEEESKSQDLLPDLVLLKVNALSATVTATKDLTNDILRLTQPRMNAVAKAALEQVEQLSSDTEGTNPEDQQAFQVTKSDAVAFFSLGSTVSQSTRVEDVWHNAVNELLVEADVHAAVIGIQYYKSENYDEISRALKTQTDKATSDIRSSLRDFTRKLLKYALEQSEETKFWSQAEIDGISTFVSILQPDPITAMKLADAILLQNLNLDYERVLAGRENIIAKHTSALEENVKEEFWKNAHLEAFDDAGEKVAEQFKQVGELIQSHALERINELMKSPALLQQNKGDGSLEEMKRFLSEPHSYRVHLILGDTATYLQNIFWTQYAAKVREENSEIDEWDERLSIGKPNIPEKKSPDFTEGSSILREPGDETGRDDDGGKESTPLAGDHEQSQDGDEAEIE
eukprot:Nk52_evm7s418 gene=Nk52_evmTU7s418